MKSILYIILILCSLAGYSQSAAIDNIVKNIQFEKVDISYDEGLRNVVDLYNIVQDSKGIFWIGSVNGLFRFNGNSAQNLTRAINENQSNVISSVWVTTLTVDEKDNIWIGTTKGLFLLRQDSMLCGQISLSQDDALTIDQLYINTIKIIDNSIFVGTRDGIFELNKSTLSPKSSYLTNGLETSSTGTTSYCGDIFSGSDESILFFSTRIGQVKFDNGLAVDTFIYAPDSSIYQYPFPSEKLGEKIVSADYKYGVVTFDLNTETYQPVTKIESLKDWMNLKSKVYIGNNLFLVNAGGKGIGVYNLVNDSYHWITSEGYIKAGNYNLNIDHQGYIWFGTRGELYKSNMYFHSKSSLSNSSIDISNIFANGQKIWSPLDLNNAIKLTENQNNIQIDFGHPFLSDTSQVSFSYVLDNKDPIQIVDNNKLQLFNLPAGKHDINIIAKKANKTIASKSFQIYIHRPFYKSPAFIIAILLLLSSLIYGIYRYNKKMYIYKANIKSKYEKQVAQLENQALRSQINPHFIFNTLNSIKYYSIQKSPEETSDFISNFSILIRRILENSKKNLITLEEEIETLKNYTEIESMRFHKGFERIFHIDEDIKIQDFLLPPMIIQPFVENAIWHGLMHKSEDRKLDINFISDGDGITCQIIDNGIGRKAAKKEENHKSHKSSLGMKITQERMTLINEKNQMNNSIEIIDLYDKENNATGTQVNVNFKFVIDK